MEKKPEIEDVLVKECTNQELNIAEQSVLNAWLRQNKKHARLLTQMRLAFLYPEKEHRAQLKNEVWVELQKRLTHKNALHEKQRKGSYWTKAAVVLIVGLSLGLAMLQINNYYQEKEVVVEKVKIIEKVSLPGQKITTTLPDGTIVKLNAESKIVVPDSFAGHTREVTLLGEAFFEVARDESKPFIIKTKDIKVEVLGTSFNVNSYPGTDHSVVAVATGKVTVSNGDEREHLISGEKISYQSNLGTIEKLSFDWEEEFGWKDNILVFQGNNLSEILGKLEPWYGVEFTVGGRMLDWDKKFSGRYQDATLNSILDGLSYVYDFEYEIEGKKILLKTKNE